MATFSSVCVFMICRYVTEVSAMVASHDSGVVVVDNGNFQHFLWLFFGYFRDKASVITWR